MTSPYYRRQIEDLANFRKCTTEHRMTILQDSGVYRHIRVAKPGSSVHHFNIVTFPGYLVFTGDMGNYVFSRLRDMFDFHRITWDHKTPVIDYQHWAEKCQAIDRSCGLTEFDEDGFISSAVQVFRETMVDVPRKVKIFKQFREDILHDGHNNSSDAIQAMLDWSYRSTHYRSVSPFHDFYEYGPFEKTSFHLRWACWAIASTIRDFDRGGDHITRQLIHDNQQKKGITHA